jgi:hypothetical protein
MNAWQPAERTEPVRLAQSLDNRARQRASADLDDQVAHPVRQACQLSRELIAQRLPALDGEPVLVPLSCEWHCATGQPVTQPQVGRVPEDTRLAGAEHDIGP